MNEPATRLSAADARSLTDEIRGATEKLYALLLHAYEGQAWTALGYNSWRDYAMSEFEMSQSRAYQLLDQARIVRAIETDASAVEHTRTNADPDAVADSTIVEVAPMAVPTESQARELRPLLNEPEKLRATWAEANRATGGKPTAAAVRQAREQISPRLVPPVRPVPGPPPTRLVPPATAPQADVEIVDAEIVEEDSRRDAELNALLAETDIKFRANFSSAMAKADDVWQFNVPRIAEVFAAPSDRQRVLSWLREMNAWCDRVSEALTKTTVLRSIGGDR